MLVYIAMNHFYEPYGDDTYERFLGVFKTMESAKAAVEKHHIKRNTETKWVFVGTEPNGKTVMQDVLPDPLCWKDDSGTKITAEATEWSEYTIELVEPV